MVEEASDLLFTKTEEYENLMLYKTCALTFLFTFMIFL